MKSAGMDVGRNRRLLPDDETGTSAAIVYHLVIRLSIGNLHHSSSTRPIPVLSTSSHGRCIEEDSKVKRFSIIVTAVLVLAGSAVAQTGTQAQSQTNASSSTSVSADKAGV